MTDTMITISQDKLGGADVLKTVNAPVPQPGIGQILIRARAAGVNPIDKANRETGLFLGQPPFVLGWDVSGTVEAVGMGVTVHQAGDEVFGMLPFPGTGGGYAQYVTAPARAFVAKPDSLTHEEAAALPLAALTAWQALVDTAHIAAGTKVLVIGAAGGVGHLAVQIAKSRGAQVTAVVSTANTDFARSLGADEVIDRTKEDFTAAVRDLDVVLDTVGAELVPALDCLRPGGTLVALSPRAYAAAREEAERRGIRAATLLVEADRLGMTEIADLAAAKQLVPAVDATYPLEQAGAAQEARPSHGKIVLVVP
jgi:NADPH:quinone reductase-like Zn-dependent oxidoreductase